MKMKSFLCVVFISLVGLAGCGGAPPQTDGSTPGPSVLPYSGAVPPRPNTAPYLTYSYDFAWPVSPERTEGHIGGDLEPRESLRHVHTDEHSLRYFQGSVRDGVGAIRLAQYANSMVGMGRRERPARFADAVSGCPALLWSLDSDDPDASILLTALGDSIQILNDALPPEFQILPAGTAPVGYRPNPRDEIMVNFLPRRQVDGVCGPSAAACAYPGLRQVYLPFDLERTSYTYLRATMVHELLHALGIGGHVRSEVFPDSILGTDGEAIPNFGFILPRIDREVLQAVYMSQRPLSYASFDEWGDTSFHLLARSTDDQLHFGVALFNGLAQPWVRGALPDGPLADNRRVYGAATWRGGLLGYSGVAPIAGDASLTVQVARLDDPSHQHDLRFSDIYWVNRFGEATGPGSPPPDSPVWFHQRDIDYKVLVADNAFVNVPEALGHEQGIVTGAFMGKRHEHMGGTVRRRDLVGAFGGSR